MDEQMIMDMDNYILKTNKLIENYKKMHEIDNETIEVLKKIVENQDQQIEHLTQMINEYDKLIKEVVYG